MGSNWESKKLGSLLEIKYGKDHKKLSDGKIPCFGSGGVMRYVDKHLYDKESILIPRKGSLNNIYYVDAPFWTVDTLFWTKIDSYKIFPKFAYYQLKLVDFNSLNVGSAVPSLTVPVLNDLDVKIPPFPEQKAIAHILGSLDDKIELNRQMNETLEAMAQALFKSWFVDFDPVIDNALAAGNAIPDVFSQRAEQRKAASTSNNAEIRALFPDAFEFTEAMGWIPQGWEASSLGKHINFQTGNAFKSKDFSDSGIRLARGDNIKEGRFQWGAKSRYWSTVNKNLKQFLLNNGDVLIGMDGSKIGKNRVRVRFSDLPCLLVQRVARLSPLNTICSGFIYLSINSERFRNYVEIVKTGSAIPHISGGQIKNFPLVLPLDDKSPIFSKFRGLTDSMFRRTDEIVGNSLSLSKLRDTLLPKLLSGELRIPDAEQLINDLD